MNLEVQKLFITLALSSPDLYIKCKKVFLPEYFGKELQRDVAFINKYDAEYGTPPSTHIVNSNCDSEYVTVEIKDSEKKWFLTEFGKFAQKRAVSNAITEAAAKVSEGDYDTMLKLVTDAIHVKIDNDFGLDYGADPKERLENIKNRSGNFSSGYQGIDLAVGKLNAGDLVIFIGGSGTGKSLFLQNLARIHWKDGRNVVYFTLELHPELCARRMDAMLLNTTTDALYHDLDTTHASIRNAAAAAGSMKIKYLPSGSKTSAIRNYVEEYMAETGTKVDVIIVDYLDLLTPVERVNTGDAFNKDKFVSEEIRNMMQEFGSICFTASQTNRTAVDATDGYNHSHIAGGLSKINTADLILGIHADAAMKARDEIKLQALKVRNGTGTGRFIDLRYNNFTMRIEDCPMYVSQMKQGIKPQSAAPAPSTTTTTMNNIQNLLNSNNTNYDPVDIETGVVVPNGMVKGNAGQTMSRLHKLIDTSDDDI